MARIGLLLSGCGRYDGTEIHEAVLAVLALHRRGARTQVLAPTTPRPEGRSSPPCWACRSTRIRSRHRRPVSVWTRSAGSSGRPASLLATGSPRSPSVSTGWWRRFSRAPRRPRGFRVEDPGPPHEGGGGTELKIRV